ncbi:MAG: hypothetical protein MJ252_14695 [archaeon]|nr:hypothetical protein [archaeon]
MSQESQSDNMEEEHFEETDLNQETNFESWKENVPHLYDVLLTNNMEWPSLTANWIPELK